MDSAHILVADDTPTVSHLLATILRTAGYEVTTVEDGVAAYEAGRSGQYDLVLLDHFMPGMIGAEVLQRWRGEGVDIPTIFLSALDDKDAVVAVLESGAVDFLSKPFNPHELLARVRIQLSRTGRQTRVP